RPRTFGDVSGIVLLLPLLRIIQPLIPRAMAPALYAFAGLVVVDRVRAQLVVTTLGDQIILMLEMFAASVVLTWLLASPRLAGALAAEGTTPRRRRAQAVVAGFCLVVCVASFATAAQGTVRLARFLGSGLLIDVFLALAVYAALKVADGLLAFAFRTWPLRQLGMVARHRDLLEPRAHRVLCSIMAGTLMLAIAALGLDLNKVTILAGAFGVGLGFGLQGMVNNFVSGLIVLLERPLQVGDTIQIGDVAGQVRRIGIRSTTVQTAVGAEVIVPNASLVAEKVTNWTLSSRVRRIDVPVGVAYGTPPEKVLELLRGVAAAHPDMHEAAMSALDRRHSAPPSRLEYS